MSAQPEALRLADWCLRLSTISDAYSDEAYEKAALELRRLHEVNTELLEAFIEARHALQMSNDTPGSPITDTIWMMHRPETLFDFMDAAIAKATGEQP